MLPRGAVARENKNEFAQNIATAGYPVARNGMRNVVVADDTV
jgi:hypothetical protein